MDAGGTRAVSNSSDLGLVLELCAATPSQQEVAEIKQQSAEQPNDAALAQLDHLSKEGSIWKMCKEGLLASLKSKLNSGFVFDAFNERGMFGETVLHVAILFKQTEIAEYLVTKYPNIVDAFYLKEEYYGETALHMAVVSRDYQLTEYLLSHGADPNVGKATGRFFDKKTGTVYYGEYAITFAIHTIQVEMVKLLHKYGADLSVRDKYGNTVFHHCVHTNSVEMFDVLMALRDDVRFSTMNQTKNDYGQSVLQYAVELGQNEIFDHMLDKTKIVGWEWGDVSFYAFPITQIDTHGDDAFSVLETIITEHRGTFVMNPVIYEILSEKWTGYGKRSFMLWFILHQMYCILLTLTCMQFPFGDIDDVWSYPLWIQCSAVIIVGRTTTMIMVELCEFLGLTREHGPLKAWHIYFEKGDSSWFAISSVTGIFKLITWCGNISSVLCIVHVAALPKHTRNIRGLMVSMMLCEWLEILMFFQAFESLGRLVVTISKILAKDVSKFLFVYGVILFAFSSSLSFLTLHSDENSGQEEHNWLDSMFIMFEISLGMGSFFGEDMSDPFDIVLSQIIYVIFLLFSVVLLLNLLIAIMMETTEEVRQQAKEQWLLQWASTVLLIERRVPRCFYKRTGNPGSKFGFNEDNMGNQYFISFTKIKQFGDD